MMLVVPACGGDGRDEAPVADKPRNGGVPATTYVGPVDGSDAYLALVAGSDRLVGYICDDRETSSWFEDVSFDEATADLENRDGQPIGEVTITADSAAGEVEVDGESHPFTAERAEGGAGWYQQTRGEPGEKGFRVTGWVILNDGTVKGATTSILGDGSVKTTGTTSTDPKGSKITLEANGTPVLW